MTEKKRKTLYWVFKILGIVVSCALPIWAVCDKFPLWEKAHGTSHSIGAGVIIALIVLIVVFRKTVFDFMTEKLNLKHAPPIVVWLVLLVISYVMIYIGKFMEDLTTVLWMGLIGCAVGTFFTYISEKYGKVKSDE